MVFSHLALTVNSSINTIIYCSLSPQFRRAAVERYGRWCEGAGGGTVKARAAAAAITANATNVPSPVADGSRNNIAAPSTPPPPRSPASPDPHPV